MRKKILSMSIAAVMTAMTSSGVMAFDTDGTSGSPTDGPILVQGTDELAGYQGNLLPFSGTTTLEKNAHPPVQSVGNLTLSSNGMGDALIFPMFRQEEALQTDNDEDYKGWGTEIVIRNTDQDHAIVAKVAVYSHDDSREVLDFNVYLSAADVVRFKIENGKLTSEDGSIVRDVPAPSSNADDVFSSNFASAAKPFARDLTIDTGYVVVYGMAQATTDDDARDRFDQRYHKDHRTLFKNYRADLDACRPGWRIGHQNTLVNGTYTRHTRTSQSIENYSVAAPNQTTNCNFSSTTQFGIAVAEAKTEAANAATLASQVVDTASAIAAADAAADAAEAMAVMAAEAADASNSEAANAANAATTASTASLMADTAAPNADTEAEYRSLSLIVNNIALLVAGSAGSISTAATASVAGNFFGDVDPNLTGTARLYKRKDGERDMLLPAKAIENFTSGNKIIWTEGEISALQDRRIQGTDDASTPNDIAWAIYNEAGIRADAEAFLISSATYVFSEASKVNKLKVTQPYKRTLVQLGNDDGYWQLDPNPDSTPISFTHGFGYSFIYNVYNEDEHMDNRVYTDSPHSSGITLLRNELESMDNLEEGSDFDGENGFALLRFTDIDGQNSGIPAIVTQMVGTTVGGLPQVNWIYSQAK